MQKVRLYVVVVMMMILNAVALGADAAGTSGADALNWRFEYDGAGLVTNSIDPGGKATKIQYGFDEQKRLRKLTRALADGTKVVSDFDEQGRRVQMADTLGAVHYDYDELNRLIGVRRDDQPKITYDYDTQNRLTSIGVGEDFKTRYTFDFLGRLAAIDSPVGKITYDYQTGQNKVIRTLPNGVRTVWERGPDGKLVSLTHVAKDNSIIMKFEYAYRPDGLIQGIKEWSPQEQKTIVYEYDNVQRLITVNDSVAGTTRYTYDPMGNRTEVVNPDGRAVNSAYDWAGRLMKLDDQECLHDPSGNLMSYPGSQGKMACEYDGANRLKSVTGGKGKVEYQYDGQGLLASRLLDGKKMSFLPDALAGIWRPLAVKDGDGRQTFYVWEGQQPRVAVAGQSVKFFLEDHLGSIRCAVDDKGAVVQRLDYNAFGESLAGSEETGLQPGFAGLFFDSGSQLYLTGARGYDPALERFLQPDPEHRIPMGSQKNLSTYAYCGADPVNFIDRNGTAADSFDASDIWNNAFYQNIQNNLFDWKYSAGQYLNVIGTGWSDWVGANRSGGSGLSYAQDQLGTFPLGDTMIPGRNLVDSTARWHDIQDYVDTHAPEGTWVTVPGPYGTEYFESKQSDLHDLGVFGRAIVSSYQQFAIGEQNASTVYRDEWAQTTQRPPPDATVYSLQEVRNGLPMAFEREDYESQQFQRASLIPQVPQIPIKDIELQLPDNEIKKKKPDIFPPPWQPPRPEPLLVGGDDPFRGGGGAAYGGGGPGGPGGGALAPSNIGGISLRGAGDALKNLGQLQGVALDKYGQLVLISKAEGEIGLPPLRLDDVVTVFRSVYMHGESPFVSIDPNPKDPHGPIMLTRQAPATVDTYPQWILFEGDRVMKTFSSGADNVTRQTIKTGIPGYQSLLALGFSNEGDAEKDANWNRFWIVPAEVNRQQSAGKELTLFDIPLKVNAEHMVLKNGQLETAPDGTPSPEAKTFADWFTANYQKLSEEVHSLPPKESGINEPVAVYTELRRVALITGIAETLRDQGVPLPFWMRDYQVKPCPVPTTTPSITVEAKQTNQVNEAGGVRTLTTIQQIYGGVDLSVPDGKIHTIRPSPAADSLLQVLPSTFSPDGSVKPVSFDKDGKRYNAVALPGGESRALGACRLDEQDLVVAVLGKYQIALARKYNSFFQPANEFGRGWTLDLPQLDEWKWPVERTEKGGTVRSVFALASPLNSWSETFAKQGFVPEVNGNLIVPSSTKNTMLGLAVGQDEEIGQPTQKVLFRNGGAWHFDQSGYYVAQQQAPLKIIYRRDENHWVRRIEGWLGTNLLADIRIEYDSAGRMSLARGSDGKTVKYGYNPAGELAEVVRPDGKWDYKYKDGFLTELNINDKPIREFVYNDRGELLSEKRGGDKQLAYQLAPTNNGVKMSLTGADPSQGSETVQYDSFFRPLVSTSADGTKSQWHYGNDGSVEYSVDMPGGDKWSATRSPDGRQVTGSLPDGSRYQADFDAAGRVTRLQQGGRELVRAEWNPDGQLGAAFNETTGIHQQYGSGGVLAETMITPPTADKNYSQWVKIEHDELGRASRMTDYAGGETRIGYDKTGKPAVLKSQTGGVQIDRDDQGRTTGIQTSWGAGQRWHYDVQNGNLQTLEYTRGKDKASVEFAGGRPAKITQFDSGKTEITYNNEGKNTGLPKQVRTPNDVVLNYDYDDATRLAAVDCAGAYRLRFDYDAQGRLAGLEQVPAAPLK